MVIDSMPYLEFNQYWLAMQSISAEESLVHIRDICYPKIDRSKARTQFNKLQRTSKKYIDFTEGKLANYKDVVKNLAGLLSNGK